MKLSRVLISMIFLTLINTHFSISQTHPSTDIFLADIKIENGKLIFSNVENITDRDGYDDEPFFTFDNKRILYTSTRDDGQADTYSYDIENKTINCVNYTPDVSEHFPSEYPIYYRGYIVLRIEKNGLRHYAYMNYNDPDSFGFHEPDLVNIGAYKDIGEWDHALYYPPDSTTNKPSSLQILNCTWKERDTIAVNISNYLYKVENYGPLYFVHKISEDNWLIKKYTQRNDPSRLMASIGEIETIIPTLPGKDVFCVGPDNILLIGSGSKLYKFNPKTDTEWHEIADFEAHGIKDITRLAVNHPEENKIAIVSLR